MDNAFETGIAFWQDDEYEARLKKSIVPPKTTDDINPVAQ